MRKLRISYSKEADTLYIRLNDRKVETSDEVSDDVILDFDKDGNVVGIEILNASKKLNINELTILGIERVIVEHAG